VGSPPDAIIGLLQDVAAVLAGAGSVDEVLEQCVTVVAGRLDAPSAAAWLAEPDQGRLRRRAATGTLPSTGWPRVERLGEGAGALGRAAAAGRPVVCNGPVADDVAVDRAWAEAHGVAALAAVPLVASGDLVGVLAVASRRPVGEATTHALSAVGDLMAAGVRRTRAEQALRDEAEVLEILRQESIALSGIHRLSDVVRYATDTATRLTGAQFGAFFYNVVDARGESYTLFTIAGVPEERFAGFPLPRNTQVFGPTFEGVGTVRLHDVTEDERYGHNPPFHGMPEGHLSVRSYLAAPVISGGGEVLGGLFFGHEDPGVFTARAERVAEGIARHAAAAMERVQMFEAEHRLSVRFQERLLAQPIAAPPGVDIAARYVPASDLAQVGGDWYDVQSLPDGRVVVAVGDVVGHDLRAAMAMSRLRDAVQLYSIEGAAPAEALDRVDGYMARAGITEYATAIVASYDPGTRVMEVARAGHPPPLVVRADGTWSWPEPDTMAGGMLGAGLGGIRRRAARLALAEGDLVVLFTDGLVERRDAPLDDGVAALAEIVSRHREAPARAVCDLVIEDLTDEAHADDVVCVVVRVVA